MGLGKDPPQGKFTPEKFPPINLPPGKRPLPPNGKLQLEHCHPQNSHLEYSHHFISYLP